MISPESFNNDFNLQPIGPDALHGPGGFHRAEGVQLIDEIESVLALGSRAVRMASESMIESLQADLAAMKDTENTFSNGVERELAAGELHMQHFSGMLADHTVCDRVILRKWRYGKQAGEKPEEEGYEVALDIMRGLLASTAINRPRLVDFSKPVNLVKPKRR
ncbi:MAG TPA: hypothetical protein VLA92_00470 [Candidatus Saccharimonadales bacterium]|nr:hypothetical protein [Candidatus Saccharimonadales bacterium]